MRCALLLLLFGAASAYYDDCLSTPDTEHVLLYPRKQCIQMMKKTTATTTWDNFWDTCEAAGGTLMHLYSSQESAAFDHWIKNVAGTALNSRMFMAYYRTSLGAQNTQWMQTRDKAIDANTTFSDHFDPMLYGQLWEPNIAYKNGYYTTDTLMYTFWSAYTSETVCEFVNPSPGPLEWNRLAKNGRSPARVYSRFAALKPIQCANRCTLQPYCYGINVIYESDGSVTCELVPVTLNDKSLSIVGETGTDYYELSL